MTATDVVGVLDPVGDARSSRKAGMSATSVDGPSTGRISAACERADQPGPSGMKGNCDV